MLYFEAMGRNRDPQLQDPPISNPTWIRDHCAAVWQNHILPKRQQVALNTNISYKNTFYQLPTSLNQKLFPHPRKLFVMTIAI